MLCCLLCLMQTNKQYVKAKQRCRDGVMSDFVSWCRHLVAFLFHEVTALHPPSFHRNDFSTCIVNGELSMFMA